MPSLPAGFGVDAAGGLASWFAASVWLSFRSIGLLPYFLHFTALQRYCIGGRCELPRRKLAQSFVGLGVTVEGEYNAKGEFESGLSVSTRIRQSKRVVFFFATLPIYEGSI